MYQSFETPAPPLSGLSGAFTFDVSESEWSPRFLGIKVSDAFPRPYVSTHSTPFVKQLIIAKCNTLVKRHCWQWNKQIDLWAASKLLAKAPQCPMSMSKYLYYRSSFIDTWPWLRANSPPTGKPKWSVYEVKVPAIPHQGPNGGGAGVSNDWCISEDQSFNWQSVSRYS